MNPIIYSYILYFIGAIIVVLAIIQLLENFLSFGFNFKKKLLPKIINFCLITGTIFLLLTMAFIEELFYALAFACIAIYSIYIILALNTALLIYLSFNESSYPLDKFVLRFVLITTILAAIGLIPIYLMKSIPGAFFRYLRMCNDYCCVNSNFLWKKSIYTRI